MVEDWQHAGFGLYVHWPFCAAKCPYCDFNSHVSRSVDHARWAAAFEAEIDRFAGLLSGRTVNTIFFGGGTPSLMEPRTVEAVLNRVHAHWPIANDIEITLEANPGSVDTDRFRGFREAGVNRVSLGVQALNDRDLDRLGRLHDVKEAHVALDVANRVFDRVSFDLIYARQDQTLDQWQAELTQALALASGHLSLYQLTIEPGTAFGDRYKAGKLRGLPDSDLGADMFEMTQQITHAAGLPAYETSNHAAPGDEARHNMIYWRYGDYLGIGPGAHSRLSVSGTREALEMRRMPQAWLDAVPGYDTVQDRAALTAEEQSQEMLMMGLRMHEGISLDRYTTLAGAPLPADRLERLIDLGVVEVTGDRLRTTPRGRPLLNAILAGLLID